jgi:hypothetical protein
MKNERTKRTVINWEAAGAFCCFTGGIGAALVGSILTASTWILPAPLHPWLHELGTGLLIAAIPLLIFSGYCLDWVERDGKSTGSESQEKARERLSVH